MNTAKNIMTPSGQNLEKTDKFPEVTPDVDIYENENEILIHASMPGVAKEEISLNLDNGKLFIAGTRTMEAGGAAKWREFGNVVFSRTFAVPQSIDTTQVTAHLENGVLELHLPKNEAARPKQIKITTS
ncbi:Hsp20/alpha crystallin family protein [Desulfogranum mediterraneum]|uniref:Hsp20/alpha crystallin family protein n=1 Tax=Desulfogranum mediterraneum TaxID=160661 RepID=UPI000419074A|nr:Hsp20/alpha crystallin family protein [Desulfogranum mediterraneum]